MRPLEEVRGDVLSATRLLGTESIDFREALGRVLAEPVISNENVPGFANSGMDGFAVRASDVATPGAELTVLEDVPAGQVATQAVGLGQAIKIMTGAPLPPGSDSVVRVEDTAEKDGTVSIRVSVDLGNHVRPEGGDIESGQTVFGPGIRLSEAHIGVLATIGAVKPVVHLRPKVAVMSTGDELLPPETEHLGPGMIRDSNRPMMQALVESAGAEVVDMGRVPDDADQLRATIGKAAVEADVIVSSGGVSMGDYDVTKIVLRDEANVDFMQVAMKPGKPFAFGEVGGSLFFGLPGNPVSVLVSFEQFVRPTLLKMQGSVAILRPQVKMVAGERFATDPAKTVFLKVAMIEEDGETVVVASGGQGSNILSAAARADGFAVVPRGIDLVEAGDMVKVEFFRSPETRSHV